MKKRKISDGFGSYNIIAGKPHVETDTLRESRHFKETRSIQIIFFLHENLHNRFRTRCGEFLFFIRSTHLSIYYNHTYNTLNDFLIFRTRRSVSGFAMKAQKTVLLRHGASSRSIFFYQQFNNQQRTWYKKKKNFGQGR